MAKISVIIPCFNMEKFLCYCLESVLGQSLSEIEVICVNDGSTDGTLGMLHTFSEKDPRVIVIDQENQGVAVARNKGIEKASGEFICFMDPDDYYPNGDILEKLYSACTGNNALVCGGSFSEDIGGRIKTRFEGIYKKYTFWKAEFVDYRDYQFDYGYHRFIYSRKMLLENGILFPLYIRFQDPPFFVRAMIEAKRFYAIPEPTYRYRVGHQKLDWSNLERCAHLISGLTDNLRMSREAGLDELHRLTLYRLLCEYKRNLKQSVMVPEICGLLKKARDEADFSLVLSAQKSEFAELKKLVANTQTENLQQEIERQKSELAELKKLVVNNQSENLRQEIERQKKELAALRNSYSYRAGRIVTWLPRKIKRILKK